MRFLLRFFVRKLVSVEILPLFVCVLHVFNNGRLHVVHEVVVGLIQPNLSSPGEEIQQAEVLAVLHRLRYEISPVVSFDSNPEFTRLLKVLSELLTIHALELLSIPEQTFLLVIIFLRILRLDLEHGSRLLDQV